MDRKEERETLDLLYDKEDTRPFVCIRVDLKIIMMEDAQLLLCSLAGRAWASRSGWRTRHRRSSSKKNVHVGCVEIMCHNTISLYINVRGQLDHQGHLDLLDLKVKRAIEERKGLQVRRD